MSPIQNNKRTKVVYLLIALLWLSFIFTAMQDERTVLFSLVNGVAGFALALYILLPLLKVHGNTYSRDRFWAVLVLVGITVLVSSLLNAFYVDEQLYESGRFWQRFVYILENYSVAMLFATLVVLYSYRKRVKKLKNMRKKIVAGNWKMNTTPAEGVALAKELVGMSKEVGSGVELIIAPPFTHLSMVENVISNSPIALSSQNCADEVKGAYTGEVSAEMIASLGAKYVILGHSERREYYGENAATLNKKIKLTYANGLTPIYCVGEKKDERESGRHFDVCRQQIEEVVFNLTEKEFETLVIAYEPVWAIGTGLTATSEQAQEIHAFIREVLRSKFGAKAENTPILYGGSCKPSNAQDIFSKPDVDGGLIGGAALVASDFIAIAKSF